MTNQPKIFFKNLDGLRFFAFLLVFLQHGFYVIIKPFEGENYIIDRVISFFFLGGGIGVQIFFVLSGFLITYLLLLEINVAGKINILQFYMRRTLRIWPLYYAVLFFSFCIYPCLKGYAGINSGLCSDPRLFFSFLANFDLINIALTCPGKDALSQNIVWSVSIEEQFYLIWPLLFFIIPKAGRFLIFLAVIIISILFRYYHWNSPGPVLYYHTFAVMADLAIGGLFAYLMINLKYSVIFFQKLSKQQSILIYSIILACYFFNDILFDFPYNVVSKRIIFDFFWGFIILDQCFSKNLLFALGGNRVISDLGKISYGLYMLHPIAILFVDILMRYIQLDTARIEIGISAGLISFLLSVILAKASYRYFESFFLRLKERYTVVKSGLSV